MHSPNRTSLVLGLLLALGATDADAWGRKKEAQPVAPAAPAPVVAPTPPPAPPPPQPMIYSGDPAAAPQVASTDLLQTAPADVQAVARWVSSSRDNRGAPFLMVDKPSAQAFVFNGAGQLLAVAPVLMGAGKGDHMLVPNTAPMSAIPPSKRITPAGRWWSRLAPDASGKEVLVIDHDAALSLHPIVPGQPYEKRATRIATATPDDNRVSFGCINAPKAFFSNIVSPVFAGKMGVVYILPETRSAAQQFGFQPDGGAAPTMIAAPGTLPAQGTVGAPGTTVAPATTVASGTTVAPAPTVAPGTPVAPATTVVAPGAAPIPTSLGAEAAQAATPPGTSN
jgi:hypothetical protein